MSTAPEPSDDLRVGRRDLDAIPGFEALGDLRWEEAERCWALPFRINIQRRQGVPQTLDVTDWYALVSPAYPAGKIRIAPAEQGGIVDTYPHQKANRPPRAGRPWRTGDLCVATPFEAFARAGYDVEPHDAPSRLGWHVKRTCEWLEAARAGNLLADGEPFELPVFGDRESQPLIAFEATAASLERWKAAGTRSGFVRLQRPRFNEALRLVRGFADAQERALPELQATWGAAFDDGVKAANELVGAWILLEALPIVEPWRAPISWGELGDVLKADGVDLIGLLERLAPVLRTKRPFYLLLGAPVPEVVGKDAKSVHWLAVDVPPLATKPADGFRANEWGRWQRDLLEILHPRQRVRWVNTANWSPDELATRGRAAKPVRESRIVVLGAGALGSAACEVLVREGVLNLSVLDDDVFKAGNLTRHTLTIGNIGSNKAVALAERLNRLSPHAHIAGFNLDFPAIGEADRVVQEAQVILDCTGSDEIIGELVRYPWPGPKLFVSCALGLDGQRFYLFSAYGATFPGSVFADLLNPWLRQERRSYKGVIPWEGTGCWHPVFPARASDVTLFAATLPRALERVVEHLPAEPALVVLERTEAAAGIPLLRPADFPAEDADD